MYRVQCWNAIRHTPKLTNIAELKKLLLLCRANISLIAFHANLRRCSVITTAKNKVHRWINNVWVVYSTYTCMMYLLTPYQYARNLWVTRPIFFKFTENIENIRMFLLLPS